MESLNYFYDSIKTSIYLTSVFLIHYWNSLNNEYFKCFECKESMLAARLLNYLNTINLKNKLFILTDLTVNCPICLKRYNFYQCRDLSPCNKINYFVGLDARASLSQISVVLILWVVWIVNWFFLSAFVWSIKNFWQIDRTKHWLPLID